MARTETGPGLDFRGRTGAGSDAELCRIAGQRVRLYPGPDAAPLVLMVHGSGWHGQQFHALASRVAAEGLAEVLVPDLRGHGADPERRGDIDYIGQLEDDLAALIDARGQGRRIVMVGHSSGGGLVVRFAGGRHGGRLDAAVLLAPYLGHRAPSSRPGSGGWARVRTGRIIALTLLNALGITALNHLPVIGFRFPAEILDGPLGRTVTTQYSFRLNTSYAPRRDWQGDLARLPRWRLLAGAEDEAMKADRYSEALQAVPAPGEVVILEGVGHLDLPDRGEVFEALQEVLE